MLRRILCLLLFLYFWATGLTNLDRFPKIHEDESWQAAPGYTFWAEGRFGTDLFAGFYGMEQHYYGFMPLFPILVGGALHLFGLGLFQARLVPLALIVLTLALTYRLGTKLFSPWHGILAVAILVTWRVAGPFPYLLSGIPLADVARIVRYDSAVPVFGLAALLILVHTLTSPQPQIKLSIVNCQLSIVNYFWIGLLTGLAALSHVYGAFWLSALLVALVWLMGWRAIKPAMTMCASFALTLTPWLIFVASGWTDFLAQNRNYTDRFGLLDGHFYLINLLNEVERYDPILNGARQSLGAWLWLVGCSLSLIWLVKCAFGSRGSGSGERGAARILVSLLVMLGSLFALLLSFKTFSYLATLWPLFALVIAAGFVQLWQLPTPRPWWRLALSLIFFMGVTEGLLTNGQLHRVAGQITPFQSYTQAIAVQLPAQSRMLGLQHYWLGLAAQSADYRSILAPIFLTNPRYTPQPLSFEQATQVIPPQIVLLDQIMLDFLAETAAPEHPLHQLGQDIWAYLEKYQAKLIGQVDDPSYGRLQIYQITRNH